MNTATPENRIISAEGSANTISGLQLLWTKMDYVQKAMVIEILDVSRNTLYKLLKDPGDIRVDEMTKLIAYLNKEFGNVDLQTILKRH